MTTHEHGPSSLVPLADDSVDIRTARERAKALEKYGPTALAPGGNPDYDILDYAINEVVGLTRYAKMLEERAKDPRLGYRLSSQLKNAAFHIKDMSQLYGNRLIAIRQTALRAGIALGIPESR
jgi:hypothetical protein